jgi:hypothetical protein
MSANLILFIWGKSFKLFLAEIRKISRSKDEGMTKATIILCTGERIERVIRDVDFMLLSDGYQYAHATSHKGKEILIARLRDSDECEWYEMRTYTASVVQDAVCEAVSLEAENSLHALQQLRVWYPGCLIREMDLRGNRATISNLCGGWSGEGPDLLEEALQQEALQTVRGGLENLTLTIYRQKCYVHANQPFFLLSRDQVRQFDVLLRDAQSAMSQLFPVSQERERTEWESGDVYDIAEKTLQEKIRFVRRPAHLQFPAIMNLTSLTVELTRNELMVLELDVMSCVHDLDVDEAEWFYAKLLHGTRHLVRKDLRVRRGAVLCGSLPRTAADAPLQGWLFFPFFDKPEGSDLCSACLQQWRQELSKEKPRKNDRRDEAWYEA